MFLPHNDDVNIVKNSLTKVTVYDNYDEKLLKKAATKA